ncbi:hypothetical protein [Staphylococcus hominis]|uniref:hypothetical protein n=1 Tax=Staphylococcus hominis TaxID=1290 RepID=UPI00119D9CE8|nr:hypothetical protein [Staphylococcus hominis]
MNQALINYQKTMAMIKNNTQLQRNVFTTTNYLNSSEYRKLMSNDIFKSTSIELTEKLRKAFKVSNNFNEISQLNTKMIENFRHHWGYNQEFTNTINSIKNMKIPNIDVLTETINDNYVERYPDEHQNQGTEIDKEISSKEKVEYLTTKLFEPLCNAIVKINESTLPTTSNLTYQLYLHNNDWYAFFMMITTIQLIIYVACYEPKKKEDEKIK